MVVKLNPSRLVKRFAANSLAVLVEEMDAKFGIEEAVLHDAIKGVAGILLKLQTDLQLLTTAMCKFEEKAVADMEMKVIEKALNGPLTDDDVVNVCKAVKNMAGTASTSLRELMTESAKDQVEKMYGSMEKYVTKLVEDKDLARIKVLLVKLDVLIGKDRKNSMAKMVPDKETINRLLHPPPGEMEGLDPKAKKAIVAVETVALNNFKILVEYLDQFFDFITKVVSVVEIMTQMKEFVVKVRAVTRKTSDADTQALFEQGVIIIKTMFTMTGYYDSPSEVSDQCWTAEQLKKTDDKDGRLLSVKLVSPVDGTRLDARREEQMMNDMRERRYQMVR
eukprot:CAMPEP_0194194280 /NCGR_PEP_ID=MMETSP0154-20130528/75499_1 /TAXON_ID=1049557 /ORGANISM="Thalassiothrix antarctica, Strain L6-D1" /LENGTH=334 /DNA_ID=CAMNT_0038918695 /DNA_START=563 /DNA_END=1564 /DNA_ORIENTATION=+